MKNKETIIQSHILTYLNYCPGVNAFRLSNHAVSGMRNGQQFFRKDKWRRLGLADICYFKKGEGVGFIEVKTPEGKLSPEQIDFQNLCLQFGVKYHVFRSLEECEAVFK